MDEPNVDALEKVEGYGAGEEQACEAQYGDSEAKARIESQFSVAQQS
jgi:hypothetical protein